jgi:dimethylglycine dehydrogenase
VIGRAPRERLVLMALDEADVTASNADATGGEPIFQDGVGVGRVTSGAYGYSVGQSLALGYVAAGVRPGEAVEVMVLGQPHRAQILHAPPFDPGGLRLRA